MMTEGKDVKMTIWGMPMIGVDKLDFGDADLFESEVSFTGRFDNSILDMPIKSILDIDLNQTLYFYAPPRRYVMKDAVIDPCFDGSAFSWTAKSKQVAIIEYPLEHQYKNFICKFFERIGSLI